MLNDFEHPAGRNTRDTLYRQLGEMGQLGKPWTDEQVASFMASSVRQSIEHCIAVVRGSKSAKAAAEQLQRLITPSTFDQPTDGGTSK